MLILEAGGQKMTQNFLWSAWNMKSQTIFGWYIDDNKWKYSSNPKGILKPEKKIMKLYTKWTFTAATTEFV